MGVFDKVYNKVIVYSVSGLDFNSSDLEVQKVCEYKMRFHDHILFNELKAFAVRFDHKTGKNIYGFSQDLWERDGYLITWEQFRELSGCGLKDKIIRKLKGRIFKYLCLQELEV